MAKEPIIESEGAALDAVLGELQSEHAVKEISGWETGFVNLSRALDGMRPGLYLFIGPPASGKTAFAKQLLDQTAMRGNQERIAHKNARALERAGSTRDPSRQRLSAALVRCAAISRQ